jgi:hypothetical protein
MAFVPNWVLAVRESIEVCRRDEPDSRQLVLLHIHNADHVKETSTLGDCIDRKAGRGDHVSLFVEMRRTFDLKP